MSEIDISDYYNQILSYTDSIQSCLNVPSDDILNTMKIVFKYSVVTSDKKVGQIDDIYTENADPETIWEQIQFRNRPHNRFLRKATSFLIRNINKKNQVEANAIKNQSKGFANRHKINVFDQLLDIDNQNSKDIPITNKGNRMSARKLKESIDTLNNDYDETEFDELTQDNNISGDEEAAIGEEFSEGDEEDDEDDMDEDEVNDQELDDVDDVDDVDEENEEGDEDEQDILDDENENYEDSEDDMGMFNEEGEGDDYIDDDNQLNDAVSDYQTLQTPFEKKQRKLREQMEVIEKEISGKKSWELVGEAKGQNRPQNSLLEVHVDVERASKPAPIITPEFTSSIEDIVKKRILENNFNNITKPEVVQDKKTIETNELSQEKSTLGLGDIYAKDFEKQTLSKDTNSIKSSELQQEIIQLYSVVAQELDGLSHYFYSPPPVPKEIKITSKPTISMEEFLPVHQSSHIQVLMPKKETQTKKKRKRKNQSLQA